MDEEKNAELAFFLNFIETKYWKDIYWYIGSLRILTNTYTTALTTKQVAKKVSSPPCLIEHIPLSPIKMT